MACCSDGTSRARSPSPTPRVRSWRHVWRAPTRCPPNPRSKRSCEACMHDLLTQLTKLRASDPDAVASAFANRMRGKITFPRKMFLIAADHPARGVMAAGGDARAMADRGALLERVHLALARPEVDGVLGTADIVDDLALLGSLDEMIVFGSMNRGGLAGSAFEIDDRFTGYTAAAIARDGLTGGKMMLRVADEDPATGRTMEACARAIDDLAALGLPAMIEVFASRAVDGKMTNDLSVDAMMRAIAIASGLGGGARRGVPQLPVVAP